MTISSSQKLPITKPSPTPEPPLQLINLLQTDPSVLEYFSALQANIDYDLQVWKNEALEGRKEINRLTKLLKCGNNSSTFISSTSEVIAKNDSATMQKESPIIQKNVNRNLSTTTRNVSSQPLKRKHDMQDEKDIGPKMEQENSYGTVNLKDGKRSSVESEDDFLIELSKEFDSNPATDAVIDNRKDVSVNVPASNDSLLLTKMSRDWFDPLLENLGQYLKKLGVALIKSQSKMHMDKQSNITPTLSSNLLFTQSPTHVTVSTKNNRTSLIRCSDLEICTDIFRALRLSIRSPAQSNSYKSGKHSRHPFSSFEFYPCYLETSDPLHPAAECIQLIFRSLTILQLCSVSYFGDYSNWNCNNYLKKSVGDVFDDGATLLLQLKGRNLASVIISSLEGELCRYWSISDKMNFEHNPGVTESNNDSSPSLIDKYPAEGGASISYSIMQGRLLQLAERASVGRIISTFHQWNRDYQRAASVVINYILQYAPILGRGNETYCSCMSLCVLETLLADLSTANDINHENMMRAHKCSWFGHFLNQLDLMSAAFKFSAGTLVGETIAMTIHVTAFNYRQRLNADDSRMRGLSLVELAAYDRILERNSCWLLRQSCHSDYQEVASSKVKEIFALLEGEKEKAESITAIVSIPLMFYMLLLGDSSKICCVIKEFVHSRHASRSHTAFINITYSCLKAYTIIEEKCMFIPSFNEDCSSPSDFMRQLLENHVLESIKEDSEFYLFVVRCSIILSDGRLAITAVEFLLRQVVTTDVMNTLPLSVIRQLHDIGLRYPLIRVINLRRRPDRLRAFLNQARHEELLVILGVSSLLSNEERIRFCDHYAYDGQGNHLDFEKTVMKQLGNELILSSYVSTHWRPSDLRAFDTFARRDDAQVRMSPSERACALSHISCWIGAERSLARLIGASSSSSFDGIKNRFLQLYQTAGVASGPALSSDNTKNPPSPVFVIMEDDAILVDRFSDRLQLLLNELPRDFHFCSLGYGR